MLTDAQRIEAAVWAETVGATRVVERAAHHEGVAECRTRTEGRLAALEAVKTQLLPAPYGWKQAALSARQLTAECATCDAPNACLAAERALDALDAIKPTVTP